MAKSLDELLSDEPEAEASVDEQPQPEGPARDEHGRFTKGVDEETQPEQAEPEPQPESPSGDMPKEEYAAMRGERERRQKAEQERDELMKRMEALEAQIRQQQQEPPAPPPSIWEDEQGAFQHFGGQVMSQASLNARLDMSEMLARRDHADFDEMKAAFLEMMAENPALQQQALQAADPWNEAYRIAKNARTMKELGATDLDTLRARIREEILAEAAANAPAVPDIPPSLSQQRNAGARTGPAWSGPTPLEDILR